jgi:hypothetical protein
MTKRILTPYEEIFAQKWVRVRNALEEGGNPEMTLHTLSHLPSFSYLKKYLDSTSRHYIAPSPSPQPQPQPQPQLDNDTTLPPFFPFSVADAKKAWTFAWTSSPTYLSSRPDGVVRVTYPAGKVGSRYGAQFRATCGGVLPASHAVLTYDVFVPRDFPGGGTRHGGKLPGFAIGDTSRDSASGGSSTSNRAASVRLMWRETDSERVKIVAYVYFPAAAAGGVQGPGVRRVSHATHMGTDLWRRDEESLYLRKGAWNTVTVEVRIPSTGDRSTLALEVNGDQHRREVTDARFAPGTRIQTVFFSTFFGGGKSYAPPKTTYLDFRGFSVNKK